MNIKHIVFLAAITTTAVSCNEDSFLDNKPQGVLSEADVQSTEGIKILINAAYAGLIGQQDDGDDIWWYPNTNWTYGSVRADDAYKGGGGTGDGGDAHRIETMQIDPTVGNLDRKWYLLLCDVQRCNRALTVLNNATDQQIAKRQTRIQEMKALRAHFFFELSRMYNQIPYFDENYKGELSTLSNVQYSRDEILEKIATDLETAAETLPETQTEIGRINKYQAAAYAAKVNLYRAYKQDAVTHKVTSIDQTLMQKVVTLCDIVINSGRYDLLPNFQDLDKVSTGDNSKEGVLQVQYSMNDGSNDAGRINWSNLLNSPFGPAYNGDGFFLPSQDLVDAYQTDENGLPLFDTYHTQHFDKWDNELKLYTASNNNVDPRLDFIVGRPGITWKTYSKFCGSYQFVEERNRYEWSPWVRNQDDYGCHCTKRFFVSPESSEMYPAWPWGASALNWNIIRYADVLLWKAEALIEQNKELDTARELINKIRRRAADNRYWVKDFNDDTQYAANYKISEYPATGWTQDYARKALRFETRLEKAMEGERFFDLVRWGIAAETMNTYYSREKSQRIYYQNSKFTSGRDEYFPVSVNQYNFSKGSYKQNPGYGDF